MIEKFIDNNRPNNLNFLYKGINNFHKTNMISSAKNLQVIIVFLFGNIVIGFGIIFCLDYTISSHRKEGYYKICFDENSLNLGFVREKWCIWGTLCYEIYYTLKKNI